MSKRNKTLLEVLLVVIIVLLFIVVSYKCVQLLNQHRKSYLSELEYMRAQYHLDIR